MGSEATLNKQAADMAALMQKMQGEFKALCDERVHTTEQLANLNKLLPRLSELVTHVDALATHVELLMKERAENHEELLKTVAIEPTRPSVAGQTSPSQVDACWEQGSSSRPIGMEANPRDRAPDPRSQAERRSS